MPEPDYRNVIEEADKNLRDQGYTVVWREPPNGHVFDLDEFRRRHRRRYYRRRALLWVGVLVFLAGLWTGAFLATPPLIELGKRAIGMLP